MHFAVAVLVPKGEDDAVRVAERMLAPYDENGEWFADGSRWDWWQVGGRWDGELLGLPPLEILVDCHYCKGTKVSPVATLLEDGRYLHRFETVVVDGDAPTERVEEFGCHVCRGTGRVQAWPTDERYSDLARNLAPAAEVASRDPVFLPYAFVDGDGWHERGRMGWFGSIADEEGSEEREVGRWREEWVAALSRHEGQVLLVDCHV